ncbi:hypothetical protein HGRIS_010464 [Hohenbuehelia grisea]|uniref:Uncharacterized protein n=1 Tax=Hohenbuehelia grisea TaxID=104357 RepID=A0ABR3IZ67_9AGAR
MKRRYTQPVHLRQGSKHIRTNFNPLSTSTRASHLSSVQTLRPAQVRRLKAFTQDTTPVGATPSRSVPSAQSSLSSDDNDRLDDVLTGQQPLDLSHAGC